MRWFVLWLLFSLPVRAANLPAELAEPLKRQSIPESAVSLLVQEVTAERPALAHNGAQPRNPASVMKLVTTAAALGLLGPAYTWNTQALVTGPVREGRLDGDLVLKGYGDPLLTTERFWQFLRALRDRGIEDIRGDLVIDGSFFQVPAGSRGAFDGKPLRAYNALPHALSINFQATTLYLRPDAGSGLVRAFTYPPLGNLKVENQVGLASGACGSGKGRPRVAVDDRGGEARMGLSGRLSSACPEYASPYLLLDPVAHAGGVFRALWRELGGAFAGSVRAGEAPPGAVLFHEQRSVPLGEAVRGMNKFSNNLMSRLLLLTLGAERSGAPGTLAGGREAVLGWLRGQGIRAPGLVLDNGSGLSRDARITAESLGQLLLRVFRGPLMPEFMASLPLVGIDGTMARRLRDNPVAGRAHVKTGSLNDVKAMAGYVLDRKGRRWAVVLMINHPGLRWQGRAAQDALLRWVYDGAGAKR